MPNFMPGTMKEAVPGKMPIRPTAAGTTTLSNRGPGGQNEMNQKNTVPVMPQAQ
jgi:hypothetical protein